MEKAKVFTRSDMKPGYVVKLRNGEYRMAIPIGQSGALILTNGLTSSENGKWNYLINWNTDFKANSSCFSNIGSIEAYDIMVVYGYICGTENYSRCGYISSDNRPVLWERKEAKKMTIAEIEDELGYSIEIVADKD